MATSMVDDPSTGLVVETWRHASSGALHTLGHSSMTVYRRALGGRGRRVAVRAADSLWAAAAQQSAAADERAATVARGGDSVPSLVVRLLADGAKGDGTAGGAGDAGIAAPAARGGDGGGDDAVASGSRPPPPPTVGVLLDDHGWEDLLVAERDNMWHLNAALYRIWVAVAASTVRLPLPTPLPPPPWAAAAGAAATAAATMPTPTAATAPAPPVVVLMLSTTAWAQAVLPADGEAFEVTPAAAVALPALTGVHLQAVADALRASLVVVRLPARRLAPPDSGTMAGAAATVAAAGAAAAEAAEVDAAAALVERLVAAAAGGPSATDPAAARRLDRVVVPWTEGLLWDLAQDAQLAATLRSADADGGVCAGSLVEAYRDDLLAGAPATATAGWPTAAAAAAVGRAGAHVCFVSRQDRGPGAAGEREPARNLHPAVVLRVLQGIGAPLYLAPSFKVVGTPTPPPATADERAAAAAAVADAAAEASATASAEASPESDAVDSADGVSGGGGSGGGGRRGGGVGTPRGWGSPPRPSPRPPNWRQATSVAGQLRTVAAECGVLFGAHGAGLTAALGLRRRAAVVEIGARHVPPRYFANVAALLGDVAYTHVRAAPGGAPLVEHGWAGPAPPAPPPPRPFTTPRQPRLPADADGRPHRSGAGRLVGGAVVAKVKQEGEDGAGNGGNCRNLTDTAQPSRPADGAQQRGSPLPAGEWDLTLPPAEVDALAGMLQERLAASRAPMAGAAPGGDAPLQEAGDRAGAGALGGATMAERAWVDDQM